MYIYIYIILMFMHWRIGSHREPVNRNLWALQCQRHDRNIRTVEHQLNTSELMGSLHYSPHFVYLFCAKHEAAPKPLQSVHGHVVALVAWAKTYGQVVTTGRTGYDNGDRSDRAERHPPADQRQVWHHMAPLIISNYHIISDCEILWMPS